MPTDIRVQIDRRGRTADEGTAHEHGPGRLPMPSRTLGKSLLVEELAAGQAERLLEDFAGRCGILSAAA